MWPSIFTQMGVAYFVFPAPKFEFRGLVSRKVCPGSLPLCARCTSRCWGNPIPPLRPLHQWPKAICKSRSHETIKGSVPQPYSSAKRCPLPGAMFLRAGTRWEGAGVEVRQGKLTVDFTVQGMDHKRPGRPRTRFPFIPTFNCAALPVSFPCK